MTIYQCTFPTIEIPRSRINQGRLRVMAVMVAGKAAVPGDEFWLVVFGLEDVDQ